MTHDLTKLSLVETVNLVSSREVSVVESVTAHVERSASLQERLNAYTHLDGERALARARQLDERLASQEKIGTLAGVSVGIKDIIDQAGLPTTCGSSFFRHVPAKSATVIRRLEEAGAIVIGRHNLSEFAFGDFATENHWWGPSRNPWDLETSPGGSSGGSAAAVAAGLSSLSIGTDTGGSVRVPAALCGVTGLKVTHGRVPLNGVFPLTPSLDTVGPLARSVADITLAYGTMAGFEPDDPWSSPRSVDLPEHLTDLSTVRIGIPHPWVDYPTDNSIRDSFYSTLDRIDAERVQLVDLHIPRLDPGPGIGLAARWAEVAEIHRAWYREEPNVYSPILEGKLAPLMEISLGDYLEVLRWRSGVVHAAEEVFAEVDLLALPSVPSMRKEIGTDTVVINGRAVDHEDAFATFAFLVNIMGSTALSLPITGSGRPPKSLQLIGPAWSEGLLLGVGMALESRGIVGFHPSPLW